MLERLKIEQVVDVFQAIKAMRIPRPGLVKSAVSRWFFSRTDHMRLTLILLIHYLYNQSDFFLIKAALVL